MTLYPKRLIEVDLPIKKISEHSRREKSIRHGHISTLHIWWARRPLAACRAVICAALWVDPADPLCPEKFRKDAAALMKRFFDPMGTDGRDFNDPLVLRGALLDFIADFANWDNSTKKEYLETSRALTQSAHESLGGAPGTKPLVVDPFAGGGSIPLEALRVGADAFASDLNPVAVLLNKVVLEYIPKYGQRLADEVRKWGEWIKQEAEKELAEFYPKDPDGATPIAYLWARTITCEGPGCGAEVPLIGQVWLSEKSGKSYAFGTQVNKSKKTIIINVLEHPKSIDVMRPISQKSSATCPICMHTTPAKNVRAQVTLQSGGSNMSRLLAVITTLPTRRGKQYRQPETYDFDAVAKASNFLSILEKMKVDELSIIPHEICPPSGALGYRFQRYGIHKWRDLYTNRQLVALGTFIKIIRGDRFSKLLANQGYELEEQNAIISCLALAVGRVNDLSSTLCRWLPSLEAVAASNGGQNKMPMILDYIEANPIGGMGGDWGGQIEWIRRVIENLTACHLNTGIAQRIPAQESILPDDIASAMVTDPPYYNAFGYSDLSEFFYPWLRRALPPGILNYSEDTVPKKEEIITIGKTLNDGRGEKTDETYQHEMKRAMETNRRTVSPEGIGVVVFANKTTSGWEAILQSIIDGGWSVTASWPILTERPNRQRAIGSAALQSSIHLVCRPRENPDGSLRDSIGDWRDVLQELPVRIHEWMPRLKQEDIVGADAIFACLGPALEIFSRYSRVEKASGEQVKLKVYLEHVWAAVAKEALAMIFQGADATGFEEDARLTAMWLWTLSTGANGGAVVEEESEDEEDVESSGKGAKVRGFVLEYDAARKIAQGLGANLPALTKLVEIKGDKARLLPVEERTAYLFGKEDIQAPKSRKKKEARQLTLTGVLGEAEEEAGGWGEMKAPPAGTTVLDRVHQAMILFAAGKSDALKRFLVEDGIGRDERFWRLAQAFSALYPAGTDEKRWVEGLMNRKKGLGF